MGDIVAKAKAALARVEVDIIPESTEAAAQPASFRDVLPPQPVEPTHDSYSRARKMGKGARDAARLPLRRREVPCTRQHDHRSTGTLNERDIGATLHLSLFPLRAQTRRAQCFARKVHWRHRAAAFRRRDDYELR